MEHRWGQRLILELPVRIDASSVLRTRGRIVELSASGALVAARTLLSPMTVIDVFFGGRERTTNGAAREAAWVVRTDGDSMTMAIEWDEFAPASVSRIIQRVSAWPPQGESSRSPRVSAALRDGSLRSASVAAARRSLAAQGAGAASR